MIQQQLKDVAYKLNYHLERFETMDWKHDIELLTDGDYGRIYRTEPLDVPNPLWYQADLVYLKFIDYPYPYGDYGVMSKRMLDVLLSVKPFPHRVLPVAIKDWIIAPPRKMPVIHDYVGVQLTEYADVFDYERSVYERETYAEPEYDPVTGEEKWLVGEVEKYSFRVPASGLPPIFRVNESRVDLFISDEARQALKAARITGTRYIPLSGYRSEVDVPIPRLNKEEHIRIEREMEQAA